MNRVSVATTVVVACIINTIVTGQPASIEPGPVLTHHNDIARSGVNDRELTLSPNKLPSLHRLGGFKVDGQVYAQPLFVPDVIISGRPRRVVYVATMRNYLYAYDADASDPDHAMPLWKIGPEELGDPVPFNFTHLIWDEFGVNVMMLSAYQHSRC